MAAKKTKRYIITYDVDGDLIVVIMHADYTVRYSALGVNDIASSETPIIDLREL